MLVRIPVDLTRRGLEDRDLQPLGQAQHIDRPVHAGLRGLDRIVLVLRG